MNKKDKSEIEILRENYKSLQYSFDKLAEEKTKIDDEILLPAKVLLAPINKVIHVALREHKSFTHNSFLYLLFRLEELIIDECLKREEKKDNESK